MSERSSTGGTRESQFKVSALWSIYLQTLKDCRGRLQVKALPAASFLKELARTLQLAVEGATFNKEAFNVRVAEVSFEDEPIDLRFELTVKTHY